MTTGKPTHFFQTCFGVFQGGGCRAIAFVGAYEAAVARGVNFAGVAGSSAGSIVAALIGAGATPAQLENALSSLDFGRFAAKPTPTPAQSRILRTTLPIVGKTRFGTAATIWEYRGLHSSLPIQTWMNEALGNISGMAGKNLRFGDLHVPTWIIATDIVSRDVKVWSSWGTPDDEVAFAVRCSCSIPGYFQPVDERFVDGGVLSNLPAFVFQHAAKSQHLPFATRTVAFTLNSTAEAELPKDALQAARALIDTVVDGASSVQQRLTEVHLVPISTGRVKATDFEVMNAAQVATLLDNGREAAHRFFDDELAQVRSTTPPTGLLQGTDEVYSAFTERLDDSQLREVWILDAKTRWLYSLYPSLLYWLVNGVKVTVFWQKAENVDPHEAMRRRLLVAMGARIVETSALPYRGFLFDPQDRLRGAAIVYSESVVDNSETRAVRYRAPLDSAAMVALDKAARAIIPDPSPTYGAPPVVVATTSDDLIARLRRYVPPYGQNGVQLALCRIKIREVISLSKVVKGFKYQQAGYLRRVFDRSGLSPFELALVRYANGTSTILTPPVAEVSGGQHILIQGNTRAVYCHRRGLAEVDCIVVRNVGVALPSNQRIRVQHMLIGDRTLTTHDRYGSDIDRDYRQIELASHHPDITLV